MSPSTSNTSTVNGQPHATPAAIKKIPDRAHRNRGSVENDTCGLHKSSRSMETSLPANVAGTSHPAHFPARHTANPNTYPAAAAYTSMRRGVVLLLAPDFFLCLLQVSFALEG